MRIVGFAVLLLGVFICGIAAGWYGLKLESVPSPISYRLIAPISNEPGNLFVVYARCANGNQFDAPQNFRVYTRRGR